MLCSLLLYNTSFPVLQSPGNRPAGMRGRAQLGLGMARTGAHQLPPKSCHLEGPSLQGQLSLGSTLYLLCVTWLVKKPDLNSYGFKVKLPIGGLGN